jgi:hypothetical protein
MSETPRIIYRPLLGISAEQARDSRAHALEFIFATYREKAAGQDNAETKPKSFERKGRRPA